MRLIFTYSLVLSISILAAQAFPPATSAFRSDPLSIPVQIHLVGESDGTDYPQLELMLAGIERLNHNFRGTDVSFCLLTDFNYIPNSSFHNLENVVVMNTMLNDHNVNDVLNLYFVDWIPDHFCGTYSFSQDGIVIPTSCFGNSPWQDEGLNVIGRQVGHYLSLPNTFGTNILFPLPLEEPAPDSIGIHPVELADGSNCAVAGDGFCDTPIDYLTTYWACNENGVSEDTLYDPLGTPFQVAGWPIMSYSSCGDSFSLQQSEAMIANAMTRPNLETLPYAGDNEPANTEGLTLLEPVQTSPHPDSTFLTFRWTSVPNADAYLIQLTDLPFWTPNSLIYETFTTDTSITIFNNDLFAPNDRIRWQVRPVNSCNVGSEGGTIEGPEIRINTTTSIATESDLAIEALSIFPNPVRRGTVKVTASLPVGDAPINLSITNLNGQTLANYQPLSANNQLNFDLPVDHLAIGLYLIKVESGGKIAVSKLAVF